MSRHLDRRDFLRGAAGASLLGACRSRTRDGRIVLRLSHSMAAGPRPSTPAADLFRELAGAATGGAVEMRVFPSGTLGQEREVVQQLQEGLVDFMVSGTAIWGSVAPKLQFFDFPFLWRDCEHVHGVVDGPVGRGAADYMEAAVGVRPLAFGDSFGFRQVVTRSRDVTEPAPAPGSQDPHDPVRDLREGGRAHGRERDPMAFGEVYTSLQTGVIDGYEHDASTTLQQRFYEVARLHDPHAPHRRRAGALGLSAGWRGFRRSCGRSSKTPLSRPARRQRERVEPEDREALTERLAAQGMTIREIDRAGFLGAAEALWRSEARALDVDPWLQAALAR